MKRKLLTLTLFFMVFSCSTNISHYNGTTPKIGVKEFFNGKIEGYGIFHNRFNGKVEKRYYVQMTGSWQGDTGTLTEKFFLDDEMMMNRKWTLHYIDEHNFIGTADDIVGMAMGKTDGYALQLKYTLKYEREKNKFINLNFNDWIYLLPDNHAINRSEMSKFGIRLGEIIFHFHKLDKNENFKEKF